MFRCPITSKVTKPREPMIKVILETRKVMYANGSDDDMHLSEGFEIVKEIGVSKEGYEILMRNKK